MAAACSLVACGTEGENAPAPTSHGQTLVAVAPNGSYLIFRDHVELLADDIARQATFHEDRIELPLNLQPSLPQLERGDILVAQIANGYWRHIERIERAGNQVVLHTRDAELFELVEEGDLLIEVGPSEELGQHRQALGATNGGGDNGGTAQIVRPGPSMPLVNDPQLLQIETLSAATGPRYSFELSETNAGQVTTSDYTIEAVQGRVEANVTFISRLKILAGRIVEEETSALAHVDTDPQWVIESTGERADRHVYRLHSTHDTEPIISILQRRFYFSADLTLAYDVRTDGETTLTAGFVGQGYSFAGVHCANSVSGNQNCRALAREERFEPFFAEEREAQTLGEGAINFSANLGISAGLVDSPSATTASLFTRLEPFQASFNSEMTVRPPYCPRSGTLSLSGRATKAVLTAPTHFTSESRQVFENLDIVRDNPTCGVFNAQGPRYCERASDCGSDPEMACFRGICDYRSPMRVVLDWTSSTDLDLYVELPGGEILSVAERQGPNATMTMVSNGGGECEECGVCAGDLFTDCAAEDPIDGQCPAGCSLSANSSSCTGGVVRCGIFDATTCGDISGCSWAPMGGSLPPYLESVSIDRPTINELYRIWVINNTGHHSDRPDPIRYEIQIHGLEAQSAAITGYIEAHPGARSVTSIYRYGVIEDSDECIPVYDSQLCEQHGNVCGTFSVVDNCGFTRENVDCGQCDEGVPCENNQCICTEQTDTEICASRGYVCGSRTIVDSCGTERIIECGSCDAGTECSSINTCCGIEVEGEICNEPPDYERIGCTSSECEEPPADLGCGRIRRRDSCGIDRDVECGGCDMFDGWYFLGESENDIVQTCSGRSVCDHHVYEYRDYRCAGAKCQYNVTNHEARQIGCTECPAPFIGPWSACNDFDDTCDQSGTRDRTHYDFRCEQSGNLAVYLGSMTANAMDSEANPDIAAVPVSFCEGFEDSVEEGTCARDTQGTLCPGNGVCAFGECLTTDCQNTTVSCANSGPPRVCAEVITTGGSPKVCLEEDECYADADCNQLSSAADPERVCSAVGGNDPTRRCVEPNSNGRTPGESCSNDSQCYNNHCRNGVCTIPCTSQLDCSGFSMNCSPEVYGDKVLNVCVPLP
ncbi:hypothetical protein DL240_02035 [Lujinxingia litoralis]|uniref:Uncharacterized protein n=1 Tax=Lujinxingia litoralis TaxID=2211119 RepID=A0A328C973_9DELT|nr:hypothetical protein [Lujinxingia litoralis]RAL25015.1 hypothetical protein DL240_02035 [Lujinxingia litoralis]